MLAYRGDDPHSRAWAVEVAMCGALMIFTEVFYFATLLTEPGFVYPREDSHISDGAGAGWSTCKKCGAGRPPRAHHCSICRCCVLRMACLRVDRYAVRLLGFAAPVHHLCSAQRRINHAFRSCTMYGGRAHQLRVSSGVWPLFVHFSASQLAHYAHGNKPGKSHDCVSRAPVVWPWLTRLFLLPDNHRVFPLSAWCAHRRADWGIAVSELFTRVAAWERA